MKWLVKRTLLSAALVPLTLSGASASERTQQAVVDPSSMSELWRNCKSDNGELRFQSCDWLIQNAPAKLVKQMNRWPEVRDQGPRAIEVLIRAANVLLSEGDRKHVKTALSLALLLWRDIPRASRYDKFELLRMLVRAGAYRAAQEVGSSWKHGAVDERFRSRQAYFEGHLLAGRLRKASDMMQTVPASERRRVWLYVTAVGSLAPSRRAWALEEALKVDAGDYADNEIDRSAELLARDGAPATTVGTLIAMAHSPSVAQIAWIAAIESAVDHNNRSLARDLAVHMYQTLSQLREIPDYFGPSRYDGMGWLQFLGFGEFAKDTLRRESALQQERSLGHVAKIVENNRTATE